MGDLDDLIKDKYTKVCICKSISRATIKESIRNGAKNIADVKRKTMATTGSCKGQRCSRKIKDLIEAYKKNWK